MYTTLARIREYGPCAEGWRKLLRHLGPEFPDDAPLRIATILESNGLDDALWCLRAVDGCEREIRLLAVEFARQVQHRMTDPRSTAALDVAERFAHGQAAEQELVAARADAVAAVAAARCAAATAAATAAAAWAYDTAAAAIDAAATAAAAYRRLADADAARAKQAELLRAACLDYEALHPFPG